MFRSLFLFLGAIPFFRDTKRCIRFSSLLAALVSFGSLSVQAQGISKTHPTAKTTNSAAKSSVQNLPENTAKSAASSAPNPSENSEEDRPARQPSIPYKAAPTVDVEQVLELAKKKNLAGQLQWKKLLHYEQQLFWTYSQIDSMNFFISPDGDDDLEAELVADIKSFWETKDLKEEESTQCIFPARYRFLKKQLSPEITQFPDRPCPRFEKYLSALRGNSVSLVFSSFYLNNPSSAFGHTFLRVNKNPATDGKRYELLDYGINYAAEADTGNALFYAFKGLFGFFPGKFTSVPYYMKVREYNNAESRDLWEYEIKSNPETVEMLISHMWELGPTYIDYWYLTENCSYHMLTVLEAADPTIDVVKDLKKWVIPSDTVKDVWNKEGLVKSFHFRPAVRTEFFHRIQTLNKEEQQLLKKFVDQRETPPELKNYSTEKQRDILDAAIDYMDFKFPHETQKEQTPEANFKNLLLRERSAIPLVTAPLKIEVPERERPHAGHGSRRWSAGYRGSEKGDDSALFGIRYALHSRTDLVTGYPEYAAITFGDFQFKHSRLRERVELEDFTLFEVISYSPLTTFNNAYSWRIKVGAEHMTDQNCLGCHGGVISGGAGYTLSLADDPNITWFLGFRGGVWYTPYGTGNRFLPGVGPSTQIRVRWSDQLISTLEGWYRRDFNSEFQEHQEFSFTTQYSFNKAWAFQVQGSDLKYDRNVQGQLLYFY